jgi:threonine dehydrogenase-like Zn-dependent dehydrogenase
MSTGQRSGVRLKGQPLPSSPPHEAVPPSHPPQPGMKLLITGAGPIGLVTLLVARAFGVTNVLITDVADSRLAMAQRLGATHTVNVSGRQVWKKNPKWCACGWDCNTTGFALGFPGC